MKIAVCDDNILDLRYYADMFKQLADDLKEEIKVVPYLSGKQLLFDSEDPAEMADIVFLDMNMPETSGVEVAKVLRKRDYKGEIIFLTLSTDYYSDAFDLSAMHYIVKEKTPFDKIKAIFTRAVETALEKLDEYILFTSAGEFRNIAVKHLKYFEILNKIVTVHYGEEESFSFYCPSLTKIEEQLYGKGFVRIHRSYLAAEAGILKLTYDHVILLDGVKLPVGRKYYTELRKAMPDK